MVDIWTIPLIERTTEPLLETRSTLLGIANRPGALYAPMAREMIVDIDVELKRRQAA